MYILCEMYTAYENRNWPVYMYIYSVSEFWRILYVYMYIYNIERCETDLVGKCLNIGSFRFS